MSTNRTRDQFAELYVAGLFSDNGWQVYFPMRDVGFDFIASKNVLAEVIIRPVQVKGKFPHSTKGDNGQFGFSGELTALHPDMVLAIPFFTSIRSHSPNFVAFLPRLHIRGHRTEPNWYSSFPARFRNGEPERRRDYRRFFDINGMRLIELSTWSSEPTQDSDV